MTTLEKIARYIRATKHEKVVSSERYALRESEWIQLAEMARENPIDATSLTFDYGLAKGYRAAKAEAKAKYRREMERHAQGYGLLTALIERHMGDEEFIGKVLDRARMLDKEAAE